MRGSAIEINQHRITPARRIMCLIAWFGIVSGIVGFLAGVSIFYHGNFFRHILQSSYPRAFLGFHAGHAMLRLAGILLVSGCIGLLRRKSWARSTLIAWAVVSLTSASISEICESAYFLTSGSGDGIQVVLRSFPRWALTLVFPVMLLWLICRRAIIDATIHDSVNRGFDVVEFADRPVVPACNDHSVAITDAAAASRARGGDSAYSEIERSLAWVGLAVAILGIVLVVDSNSLRALWYPGLKLRLAVSRVLYYLSQVSYVLLLGGSFLLLMRWPLGRRIVLSWAVIFLALIFASAMLDELMYLWWIATKPTPEPMSAPEIIVIYLFEGIQSAAFACIALFSLIVRDDPRPL